MRLNIQAFGLVIIFLIGSCQSMEQEYLVPETTRLEPEKPLMKDFMGLNVHLNFKPKLYHNVAKLVRNYHPLNWDIKAPGDSITLPYCWNGVNWEENAYGKWTKHGYEVDVSVEINPFGPKKSNYQELWQNTSKWSYDYGYRMADYFGSSSENRMISSIEVGNEPGKDFADELYTDIFINMARGIRAADPSMKIVTCNAQSWKEDKWAKNLDKSFGSQEMLELFDVISLHLYTVKDENADRNPWERSYPEDLTVLSNKVLSNTINWRNKYASDKELWITEFGWDAVSEDMMSKREGWFKKMDWAGVSDLQQAQFLVRSFLFYSEKDVQRAYIYFYNDENEPSVHAASGITRKFKPKKSFWAVKQLYETLGEYRFSKVIRENPQEAFIYEYVHGSNPDMLAWVLWSPTDSGVEKEIDLSLPGSIRQTLTMATSEASSGSLAVKQGDNDSVRVMLSESPGYILMSTNPGQ